MKELLIVLVLAMFATAWVMDQGGPPKPQGTRITIGKDEPCGLQQKDNLIGNFTLTDGFVKKVFREKVYDDKDPKAAGRAGSCFPLTSSAIPI